MVTAGVTLAQVEVPSPSVGLHTISVMAFSSTGNPGPAAPFSWWRRDPAAFVIVSASAPSIAAVGHEVEVQLSFSYNVSATSPPALWLEPDPDAFNNMDADQKAMWSGVDYVGLSTRVVASTTVVTDNVVVATFSPPSVGLYRVAGTAMSDCGAETARSLAWAPDIATPSVAAFQTLPALTVSSPQSWMEATIPSPDGSPDHLPVVSNFLNVECGGWKGVCKSVQVTVHDPATDAVVIDSGVVQFAATDSMVVVSVALPLASVTYRVHVAVQATLPGIATSGDVQLTRVTRTLSLVSTDFQRLPASTIPDVESPYPESLVRAYTVTCRAILGCRVRMSVAESAFGTDPVFSDWVRVGGGGGFSSEGEPTDFTLSGFVFPFTAAQVQFYDGKIAQLGLELQSDLGAMATFAPLAVAKLDNTPPSGGVATFANGAAYIYTGVEEVVVRIYVDNLAPQDAEAATLAVEADGVRYSPQRFDPTAPYVATLMFPYGVSADYAVQAIIEDAAGNREVHHLEAHVDFDPPVPLAVLPAVVSSAVPGQTFEVVFSEPVLYSTLVVGGETMSLTPAAAQDRMHVVFPALSDGVNEVEVKDTFDKAGRGQSSVATLTVTVDTTAPLLTAVDMQPLGPEALVVHRNSSRAPIALTASEPGCKFTVTSTDMSAWSTELQAPATKSTVLLPVTDLPSGTIRLAVALHDAVGNTPSGPAPTFEVVMLTQPLDAAFTSAPPAATADSQSRFTVECSRATGCTYRFFIEDVDGVTVYVCLCVAVAVCGR